MSNTPGSSLTTTALMTGDMRNDIIQTIDVLHNTDLTEDQLNSIALHRQRMAEIGTELGARDALYNLGVNKTNRYMAAREMEGVEQALDTQREQNASARNYASRTMELAMRLDEHTDTMNKMYAESGFSMQSAATKAAMEASY